jgi:curved DNA-binding protein
MKYKDYYAILGVDRNAGADEIKRAYRKLARKYHPDVSKEKDAEEKFKEVSEAYETLRDPEKKAAYDQLGQHRPGEEFRPPPDWGQSFGAGGTPFGEGGMSFEDIDLSDLFAGLSGRARRGARDSGPIPGRDVEAQVRIAFEQAFHGGEIELSLSVVEYADDGTLRRVPRRVRVRIPPGVTDGQVLRVPGKGGSGWRGAPPGDLYLDIRVESHPLFRVEGLDLYMDLPLAPWEAVLGTSVEMPTPAGRVTLKVPAGAHAGQKLRLSGRGMARADGRKGDLYAVVEIVVPAHVADKERALYAQLRDASTFDPRAHFAQEASR